MLLHFCPQYLIAMFANNRAILLTLISFGLTVSGTPEVIKNFYEKILSSPGSTGQILTSIKEIVHDDYEMRPNDFNLVMESGPDPMGLRNMMIMMDKMLPGLYYKPIKTSLCRYNILIYIIISRAIIKSLKVMKMYEHFKECISKLYC